MSELPPILVSAGGIPYNKAHLDAKDARIKAQSDYSIDLARIIEALCSGTDIPEPKTTARHHYEMAVASRRTPTLSAEVAELVEILRKWAALVPTMDGKHVIINKAADRLAALSQRVVDIGANAELRLQRLIEANDALEECRAEKQAAEARLAEAGKALLAVVSATRAYLPPDGIDAQECLNRILAATDNPTINPVIHDMERNNGRS